MNNTTSSFPPGAARTLSALEQFHRLRGQITDILNEAIAVSEMLGHRKALVSSVFEGAKRAIDLSRLNLAIIGAEGQGKSTLIQMILGTEVSPVEAHLPGTVAPVIIEWGKSATPEYNVFVERDAPSNGEPIQCADLEAFKDFILQKANPDNHKRVIEAHVKVDHQLLRQGLRIVDLPGVEGVSETIGLSTREFIRERAHAVIGVLRDRSYAPLIRLFDEFLGTSKEGLRLDKVQAIMNNVSTDFYVDCDTPEKLDTEMSTRRERALSIMKEEAAKERSGFKFDLDRYFILHLPSIIRDREKKRTTVPTELLRSEVRRFQSSLDQFIRDRGLLAVITDGTGKALIALSDLNEKLRVRQRVIEALLHGDPKCREEMQSQFIAAAERARASWNSQLAEESICALSDVYWRNLKPLIDGKRDEILAAINATQNSVDSMTEKLSKDKVRELKAAFSHQLQCATEEVNSHVQSANDQLLAEFCTRANEAIIGLDTEVPVLEGRECTMSPITPTALFHAELGSLDETLFHKAGRLLAAGGGLLLGKTVGGAGALAIATKLGLVGGLYVAGGAAAVGLAPLTLGLLCATAGAAIGKQIWDAMRDGRREAVLKALNEAREQAHRNDTSEGGDIWRRWRENVASCITRVDLFFEQQITERSALINTPEATLDQLQQSLSQINIAINEVHELEKRLTKVDVAAME